MKLLRANVVLSLVVAEYLRRPRRLIVTTLATIAAACVVVWVVSSYDSLLQHLDQFSDEYLGRYQVIVVPARPKDTSTFAARETPVLPAAVLDELRHDNSVESIDPVIQARVRIEKPATTSGAQQFRQDSLPVLAGTNAVAPPYPLTAGVWILPENSDKAAISAESATSLGIQVGDSLTLSKFDSNERRQFTIAGIVDQPDRLPPMSFNKDMPSMRAEVLQRGPADAVLYVSQRVALEILGDDTPIAYGGIVLKSGVNPAQFIDRIAHSKSAIASQAELQSGKEIDGELEASSTSQSARIQSYSATALSLLAALFIIMSTLNMSVLERTRQFAILRSIALTNLQVFLIVILEGILLGLIGWLGGLLAGWALLQLAMHYRPALLPAGASLGTWCVLLSGVCALGGAMLASLYPAYRAVMNSPLDGIARRSTAMTAKRCATLTGLGVALVSINPWLMFAAPIPNSARYALFATVGCTTTAIGFLLTAPAVFSVIQRMIGPVVARLLRLDPQLFAAQLSANLWRSIGMAVTLSVGLSLFVAMQTWGYSMLRPFMPGAWMPDVLVTLPGRGASDAQLSSLAHADLVKDCLPLAIEQPKFAHDITGAGIRATVTRQDNCILAGVDVDHAFAGTSPMLNLDFVNGTREQAIEKLRRGRYCLVPDHFARQSGLGIGSSIELLHPADQGRIVSYEIAGVVALDGWHLASKAGLRTRSPRSAAMIFAPIGEVQRNFDLDRTKFLWINVANLANEAAITKSLQAALDAVPDSDSSTNSAANGQRPSQVRLQVTSTLRGIVQHHADAIIWGLSKLPLVTLLVTSLGVASAMFSSIQSRYWELGVLRSIGMTRFAVLRLLLAEAALVSVVACVLSLGFGVAIGYNGTEVTRYVDVHGGLVTPLVIPWLKIAPGMLAAVMLSIVAVVVPAVTASWCEPLSLLRRGRLAG